MWIIVCQTCDPTKVIAVSNDPQRASHDDGEPTPILHNDSKAIYAPDKEFEGLSTSDAFARANAIKDGVTPDTEVYETIKATEIVNLGGGLHGDGDLEVLDGAKGVILETPNGGRKRIKILDDGTVVTENA